MPARWLWPFPFNHESHARPRQPDGGIRTLWARGDSALAARRSGIAGPSAVGDELARSAESIGGSSKRRPERVRPTSFSNPGYEERDDCDALMLRPDTGSALSLGRTSREDNCIAI